MNHEAARRRLSGAQAALLTALLAGTAAPDGFDPERLRIEAAALLAKRRRVIERLRPDLPDVLGERFAPHFDEWAASRPRRTGVTARADADAFATWLASHGHLCRPAAGAADTSSDPHARITGL